MSDKKKRHCVIITQRRLSRGPTLFGEDRLPPSFMLC